MAWCRQIILLKEIHVNFSFVKCPPFCPGSCKPRIRTISYSCLDRMLGSGYGPICWGLFHKGFMNSQLKSCENFVGSNVVSYNLIMSQFCTCHDSWAVMTCAEFWHDWIIIFNVRATCIFTRFGLDPLWNGSVALRASRGSPGWLSWTPCCKQTLPPSDAVCCLQGAQYVAYRVRADLERCLKFSGVFKKCLIFNFPLKMIIFPGKVLENDNFILEK